MNRRTRRTTWCAVLAAAGLLAGCVERSYIVTTDPPGAVVYENGKPIGATPADGTSFVYYGRYGFTLVKEGYETLQVEQDIRAPWYQYFPLDFVSENMIPWTLKDQRRFHFEMKPLQAIRTDEVVERAQQLRARGQAIGAPQQ